MTTAQRDRILKAADKAFIAVNGIGLEESFTKSHQIFSKLAEASERLNSLEKIEAVFETFPELNKFDEQIVLMTCKYAPHLLRIVLSRIAATATAELPSPLGGRPRSLPTLDEELEVCRFIGGLLGNAADLKNAQHRASQRFGVSESKVQKIWAARQRIRDQARDPDFATILLRVERLFKE